MCYTLVEKILARATGDGSISPGKIIDVPVDRMHGQ
jgi:hypothetical protein